MNRRTKNLELFNPPGDILEFYKENGHDYTEWYEHSDSLFDFIDEHFPLVHHDKSYQEIYQGLLPAKMSPFNLYFTNKNLEYIGSTIDGFYKVNSSGLRCDEFSKEHDGLHILFAGCSITFGDGIPLEYSWPHKVYEEITKQEPVSGYYNIAGPGFNHSDIYYQVFKYIELYGNPDYIFINFPDLNRQVDRGVTQEALYSILMPMHNALLAYAKQANIKLIMFSWDMHSFKDGPYMNSEPNQNDIFYANASLDPRKIINNSMHLFTENERLWHMQQFEKNNKTHPYRLFFTRALDIVHPGIAEHDFYFNFAYKIWEEKHGSFQPTA